MQVLNAQITSHNDVLAFVQPKKFKNAAPQIASNEQSIDSGVAVEDAASQPVTWLVDPSVSA